jgi:tetratricopeptide (TPR) repeat protein
MYTVKSWPPDHCVANHSLSGQPLIEWPEWPITVAIMDNFYSSPEQNSSLEQPLPASRSRRLLRGLGFLFLILAFLATLYGSFSYVAWQKGQVLRAERARTDLEEQVARQTELARTDIAAGNYLLALRRLDWVLERRPEQPEVQLLRDQAQRALNNLLTPLPTTAVTPSPSPTPFATSTAGDSNAAQQLNAIQTLLQDKQWETAIDALIVFQNQNPSYERWQTDRMLYETYTTYGVELLYGEQVELGLYYLERAERLGDLPQSVLDQQLWAKLYLQGVAYYGVNWGVAVYYFRDLCLAAPFFQNACDRLYTALIAQGDQYAVALDWCPARPAYSEAYQLRSSQPLAQKIREANEGCLTATPTPLPESTPAEDDSEQPIPTVTPTEG